MGKPLFAAAHSESGWLVCAERYRFEVMRDGRNGLDAEKIRFDKGQSSPLISSMFGYGIVTFVIPYLFRTPSGMHLLARGPATFFVDGAAPLDGIIETDWLPHTFTMNWKLTRKLKWVQFQRGEPFCMIVPLRCGEIESLQSEIGNLESEPHCIRVGKRWHESRFRGSRHRQSGRESKGTIFAVRRMSVRRRTSIEITCRRSSSGKRSRAA